MNTIPPSPLPAPPRRRAFGFSLVEVLVAAALVTLAAAAGVMFVARGTQHADGTRDRVFARQKALSILE